MSDPIGGGIQDAASQVRRVACGVGSGVREARGVIRAQPIAAALVIMALGYFVGRLASAFSSRQSFSGRR
jgi:hypothetical protein